MITVGREATAAYSPPVGVKPNGTHFKKFAVLFCLSTDRLKPDSA